MPHLIDEFWSCLNQLDDLVLIAFSVDVSQEVISCPVGQKACHWLYWEVYRHDVVIFLYFNVSCILLEELVDGLRGECLDFLADIWKSYCQLVYQAVDVEALNDTSLE